MRRLTLSIILSSVTILAIYLSPNASSQELLERLPAVKIQIDEALLDALVDEPCHHFEAAYLDLESGHVESAARHLTIGATYLRLELARADANHRSGLHEVASELESLGTYVRLGRIKDPNTLRPVFARAHFALSTQHCIASSHRCCDPESFSHYQHTRQIGKRVEAAAVHLEQGLLWSQDDLDPKTQELLETSRLTSQQLIQQGRGDKLRVLSAIDGIHEQLENITGMKISLAPRMTHAEQRLGPAINR